jgi:serine/threonine protein kinase
LASSANAYNPTDPMAPAVTEASAREPGAGQGMDQTRVDATALVAEVPVPIPSPVRGYTSYEPGVIVAQKFQLVRILGEGGMGSVWVAKNLALDVHVALKLIRAELARNVPGLEERLLQEARAAASIEHPAVIKIFDFGLTELSDPFIAMELLHGESLGGTVKRRGKLNPVRAVQTLLPITEALFAAHERGIVHRDLKPDNIFLARGSGNRLEPKVLDFGIAKFDQNSAPSLTSVGTVLGSPAYMSPEQARGEADVDGRTDVWALCVVLYEVITGGLPFWGENYNALLYAILEGQPKTFSEQGINEPLLWSIISRGLEKNRERRCPDMLELGRGLAMWLLDRGVQEDVTNANLRSKWLERPQRKAITEHHSFFPTDPPCADSSARTMRSGEGQPDFVPVDENGELSSGVLLRPAGETSTNHLFGVPYSAKTGQNATPVIKRPARAGGRWIWFTVAGTLLSFSAAVALQALSSSRGHEDDEPPPAPPLAFERRHKPLVETTVQSVVEMPRPLTTARVTAAPSPPPPTHRAPVFEARPAEPRPSEPRITAPKPRWEPKPARNDLKNPFR